MSSSNILGDVVGIIARVLGVSPDVAGGLSRSDCGEWDSLKHIEIVFQVEDEFDLQFGERDIAELGSAGAIVSAIERISGR